MVTPALEIDSIDLARVTEICQAEELTDDAAVGPPSCLRRLWLSSSRAAVLASAYQSTNSGGLFVEVILDPMEPRSLDSEVQSERWKGTNDPTAR